MNKSPAWLLIWLLCPLLAVVAGYMMATPLAYTSLSLVGMVLMLLLSPLLLRWHHELLIFSWNSFFIVFFLPGQPSLGVTMACLSLLISVLTHTLRKNLGPTWVPSVAFPLLLLAVVALATAAFTGGIGTQVFGSSTYGGKRYLTLFGAVLGYFALTAKTVAPEKAQFMAAIFFLSGLSGAASDLIYAAGPSFYFLFTLFSANLASLQAISQETLLRFSGFAWGALALCYFLLMRYNIVRLAEISKPWRLAAFVGAVAIGALGGFRSVFIILGLLLLVQFIMEGLYRSRLLIVLLPIVILVGILTVAFVDKMPLAVQRSLSFLPIEVDAMAKHDASSTLDWRFQMWKTVLPEVPKYFLVGKGFGFNSTDLYLTQEAISRGFFRAYEDTLITGNYHQGLLTTIIPFGIFGLMAFLWFSWSSLRVLHANFRYGDPAHANINTFLYAFFVTRLIFFLTLYGQLDLDLLVFTGTVGLSVSINHGVRSRADVKEPVVSEDPVITPGASPVPVFARG